MAKKGSFSKVYDKNGDYADVEAVRFDGTRTVQMQGDVTASQTWNGDPSSPLTLNASIGAKKVTQEKIGDKAVGTGQMADGSVGLTQIAASAMTDSVSANNARLVTSQGVNAAIAAATLNRGKDYGPLSVDEINAISETIPTGSTVYVESLGASDAKVINDGYSDGTMASFSVEVGEDLKYYRAPDNSLHGWYSAEANVKRKQPANYSGGIAVDSAQDASSGSASIEFIQSFKQNTNGDIRDIVKAQVDIVDSTSSTRTNAAATPNSVKSAYDLANTANTVAVKDVTYDSTNKKITKTINGQTTDVVSAATLKTGMALNNVDNTSDANKPVSTAQQEALDLKLDKTGDGKDVTVSFSEASTRANIGTGEKLSVMFGKIKKWFTDLKALAFKDTVSDSDISGTISDSHIASASAWNGKADKVSGATNGNFAALDSNGNLTDSGKKASDFATAAQGTKADSAIQGVKVNNTTLTPDANKVVTVPLATTSADGAMSAADKTKLDNAATYTQSSGNAPVKVGANGELTAVQVDSYPNQSHTDNLISSKGVYDALLADGSGYNQVRGPASNRVTVLEFTIPDDSGGTILIAEVWVSSSMHYYIRLAVDDSTMELDFSRSYGIAPSENLVVLYKLDTSTRKLTIAVNVGAYYALISKKVLSIRKNANSQSVTYSFVNGAADNTYTVATILKCAYSTNSNGDVGSASVPVYLDNGEIKTCTDDFVHDGDVAQTYSSTSEAPISGAGVAAAIAANDLSHISQNKKWYSIRASNTGSNQGWFKFATITKKNVSYESYRVIGFYYMDEYGNYGSGPIRKYQFQAIVNFSSSAYRLYVGKGPASDRLRLAKIDDSTYEIQFVVFSNKSIGIFGFHDKSNGDTNDVAFETGLVRGSAYASLVDSEEDLNFGSLAYRSDCDGSGNNIESTYVKKADGVTNVEYVANQSGGGGNLNKTINGQATSVLTFMNDSEAVSIWNDAKTAAANAS